MRRSIRGSELLLAAGVAHGVASPRARARSVHWRGSARAAVTSSKRRGGRFYLDEIAELSVDLQAKLLRIVEAKKFRPLGAEADIALDVRILAATHVDLEGRIAEGRFREDLYYRLKRSPTVDVPSLHEREEDIPELVQSFVAATSRKLRFGEPAMEWLKKRPWPGNVRELRNVVERLALLAETDDVDVRTLDDLARPRTQVTANEEIDRLARRLLALPERLGSKLRVIERAVLCITRSKPATETRARRPA